jgi:gliding motility associated protien GldN
VISYKAEPTLFIMTKYLFLSLSILFTLNSQAQTDRDIFARTNAIDKKLVPYTSLAERDVMWSKRIWRIMDLKEKMNHPFYYPLESYGNMNSLFSLIRNHIKASELIAYDAIDDQFTVPLTKTAASVVGDKSETIFIENPVTEILEEEEIPIPLYSGDVMRFRIKEEWFFDKQRSVMDVRIIGICPVIEVMDDNGDYKGELPMYWIYFPEVRSILARQETVNRWNDAERRTYDDLFLKRFFSSYVYKESNVYNRKISEYKVGLDALLEAKDIHNQIDNFEQDLWEY